MLTKKVCLAISRIHMDGMYMEYTSVSVASYSYSYSESDVGSGMTRCVIGSCNLKNLASSPCLH